MIHSDFERGFIKAETVAYDDLVAAGSMAAAREKGLVRQEGKDYVVKDGDVMLLQVQRLMPERPMFRRAIVRPPRPTSPTA